MPRFFSAVLCGALLLAALGRAQSPSAGAIPKLAIEHYQLANGMQVILFVDHKAPVVNLNLRYRVGSKNERPGRTGFAHLFEHIMYDGVDPSADFQTLTERIGATDVNGRTQADYTEFYETVPASRLERMLWLESNRIAKLTQALTQAKFDTQREVVRNELRERIENQPYVRMSVPLYQHSFPEGHPYGHEVLGSHEDLLAASLDDVRAFYREYYTPDNLSLVLAGDFDPAQARQWVAKYFGSLAPGLGGLASPVRSAPQLSTPKLVELRDRVPEERIFFAWPAAGAYQPDDAALEVAAYVLTDGPTRLNSALSAQSEQIQMQDASIFLVSVPPASGKTLADVDKVIAAEIARLAREGPSDEELIRARNNLEFQQLAKLENLYDLAKTLNQVQQFYGGVEHFDEWANRYSRVTAEGVRAAVGRWLATPNRLAIDVTPQTAQRDSTPEPDRNQPPPFQAGKPYHAPDVKSAKLANGLQIFVVERHELPKVAVELRFKLGLAHSPPGKAGLALLTMATVQRGTSTRTAGEIERECSRLATVIRGNDDAASQGAGFEVLRKNLDPALQLLADVMRHPSFPEDGFESQKKDFLDEFEKAVGRIDNFSPAMMAIAFGRNHPLGNWAGTTESYRSITRLDALDFQGRYWKPDVAVLVFAGDITLDDAVALATKHFGDWSGTAAAAPPLPAAKPIAGRIFLIDRPGATQTTVVQVLPGIPRDHPDFPALLLVNLVWGGLFSSRLMQNIRQAQGIAYGAESEMWGLTGTGLWLAHSAVQADKTHGAMLGFLKELRGIAGEKPITALELETAKENFMHAYPAEFELSQGVAQHVSQDWASGLPVTYMQILPQRVADVSLAQANAAARKYALVDRAFFLLIGDRQQIEPGLRELGMGEVVVMP